MIFCQFFGGSFLLPHILSSFITHVKIILGNDDKKQKKWVTAKIGLNGLDPDLDQNKHRMNLE
jgi:hypothetical protein